MHAHTLAVLLCHVALCVVNKCHPSVWRGDNTRSMDGFSSTAYKVWLWKKKKSENWSTEILKRFHSSKHLIITQWATREEKVGPGAVCMRSTRAPCCKLCGSDSSSHQSEPPGWFERSATFNHVACAHTCLCVYHLWALEHGFLSGFTHASESVL
jgi:hypothetical protein